AVKHPPDLRRTPPPHDTIGEITSAEILPVLVRHCSAARGCHGEAPTESVSLDLRPASARASLVNREAGARSGAPLVKPGDAVASFLIVKLVGPLGPGEGKLMPLDVDTGATVEPRPLPRSFVRATLEPWIAAGAPDN